MKKGNPTRNLKRDFLELTASPYEYCYDSPVRFTDPTGEQPPINANQWFMGQGQRMADEVKSSMEEAKEDVLISGLLATAFSKTPELLNNHIFNKPMPEWRKQEIFSSDFEASVGVLLYEFATGTGPSVRDFSFQSNAPNSFANKVAGEGYVFSDIVSGIYRRVEEENINAGTTWAEMISGNQNQWDKIINQPDPTQDPPGRYYGFSVEFSPDQVGLRLDKMLDRHRESNIAQLFMGGMHVKAYPIDETNAYVILDNTTSKRSAMLHATSEADNKTTGPLSNITQRIHVKITNLDPAKSSNYSPTWGDRLFNDYIRPWQKSLD